MAEHFQYHFEGRLQEADFEQDDRPEDEPLLDEVLVEATETVAAIEQVGQLPAGNQKLVLDMAAFAVLQANGMFNSGTHWQEDYWGLYIVGSRARGEERPDSDLDLLSVGTFYRNQGFAGSGGQHLSYGVFKKFDVDIPDELPGTYNVGEVDRKYLIRATPQDGDVLPVDLSVVDMTFMKPDLEEFKREEDVDENGTQLVRIPLLEVTVAAPPPLEWSL